MKIPIRKIRYFGSVSILYGLTLLFAAYLLRPTLFSKPVVVAFTPPPTPTRTVISGKPSRLVINSLSIDKPVNEGRYDTSTHTWTLSGGNVYFAMPTALPNDFAGNTLIYGHYNLKAFYYLKNITPGSLVDVYTDNGHVFTYQYYGAEDLKPNDVSVFRYQGPPRLTIQTCSGSFYEQRRLFYFSLMHVDGHAV